MRGMYRIQKKKCTETEGFSNNAGVKSNMTALF